ncbi:MAG: hypothetical protein K0A94_11070 [Desulfuromonadales bacterium]|nr:hypothetical protein [Desulfuromonadales bacterium]
MFIEHSPFLFRYPEREKTGKMIEKAVPHPFYRSAAADGFSAQAFVDSPQL